MEKRSRWTRTALAGVLALATMGAPLASARDRCDRGYGRNERTSYRYDNRGYGNYSGYSGYGGNYSSGYVVYQDRGYRDNGYRDNGYRSNSYSGYGYRQERSAGKSAAIVGGSAAAGAVVGAIAGGGKGAAIGAVVGGLGGVVVDQATRNNRNNYYQRR